MKLPSLIFNNQKEVFVMTTETEITTNDTEVLMKNISFLEKMGGRKYTLAIIIILLASALCWFAKISDSIYSLIVVTAITTFSAANVTQKITANK